MNLQYSIMKAIRLFFIFAAFENWVQADIRCRDENNNPVDWYVIYKLPKLLYSSTPYIKQGKGYMFITSATIDKGWTVSSNPVDTNTTLFANTLSFLKDSKQVLWFIYNDQGPTRCDSCGHTKGVVGGDKSGGIWLVHSIPYYLNETFPLSGMTYAQSAICISLSQEELNSIGDLLAYNAPNFQKWNIINDLMALYPKLLAAFHHVKVQSPWTQEKSISTLNGTKLHGFAKAKRFHRDLYEWVASSLQTDLFAETWINDEYLPSSCSLKYRVMNVLSMNIPKLDVQFTSHKDHSKLAISSSYKSPWVCIGDINRAQSQERRGGGTVCFNNTNVWHSYHILLNSTEDCSLFKAGIFPSFSNGISNNII